MLQNYIKIAFRHLFRNKLYVLINILGLGLALACCIIAYLNWKFNHDFDAIHTQGDYLFRVEVYKGTNNQLYGISPLPLGNAAVKDLAGISQSTRLNSDDLVIKSGDDVFNERMHYADENFLGLFDFQVIKGDRNCLADKSKVMVPEKIAKKYFGNENPVGLTLLVNPGKPGEKALTIGAVMADFTLNSCIQFDFLTHFDNQIYQDKPIDNTDWSRFVNVTFLKLRDPSESGQIAQNLNRYVGVQNSAREDWPVKSFYLEPLAAVAKNGRELRGNLLWPAFPPAAVWGPIVMAILLLITACLNFTNTTISLSNRRLKEMGIRKVMGGTQKQLIGQLLSESFVICVLALFAGFLFVDFLLPPYNKMWDYLHLEPHYLENTPLLIFIGLTLVVTVILGGAYPAFYISAFNPTRIFRGSVKFGGSNLFSRILLGVQVMISLVAVVAGIAFAQNSEFQQTTDIGYEHKDVLVIPTLEKGQYESFRNAVEQNPKILTSAGTRDHLEWYYTAKQYFIHNEPYEAKYFDIGENYFEVMDMEIVKGRNLDPQRKMDFENALLVNESFVKAHQWAEPIGKKVTLDSVGYSVVGVVKDFYYDGFWNPLEPVIMKLVPPEEYRFLVLETNPNNLIALNDDLKSKWNALFPFKPYDGFYQSDLMGEGLKVTQNITTIMFFLAIVTILLSSAGLFALVSLNILKRLKEIAIRKIVGASNRNISWLINKNYVWIFLFAAVGGSIGGSFMANKLLDSIYGIHVEVSWLILIAGSLAVFVIAGMTVAYKIGQVVRINLSDILRSE